MKKLFLGFAAWLLISLLILGTDYDYSARLIPQVLGTMMAVALVAPAAYIAAFRLTPKYLYTKKPGKYLAAMFTLIVINASLSFIICMSAYKLMTGIPVFRRPSVTITLMSAFLVYGMLLIVVSCAVKIIADRFSIEQRLLETQKEKTETELNFLRSQVNPHFLFNIMNTIYFQIDKENASARESLEKFSEMLRYQLYECTTDRVDIGRESAYIKNYVDIQSLRMERGTDIRMTIDENLSGFSIAPLLILPLIENAFKHISRCARADENKIHISLRRAAPSYFILEVLNSFDAVELKEQLIPAGGVGIPNLQRRLDLLYPRRYELSQHARGRVYATMLKINYHD